MHHFMGLSVTSLFIFAWVAVTWIKANARREERGSRQDVELLSDENEMLRSKIGRLEERLAVIERINTDPARRLDREIEALRHAS